MRLPHSIASVVIPPLLGWYSRTSLSRQGNDPAQLRAILRTYPFWGPGHQKLGEAALHAGDIATAYASAQAARTLSHRRPRAEAQALHLLGRCFLARGDWQEALLLLQQARTALPSDPRIQQDEAAALMLGGENAAALEILSAIPDTILSADGKAAREYLRAKGGAFASPDRS